METKKSKDEISLLKAQTLADIKKLEAQSTAKEVSGKSIGKFGLTALIIISILLVISAWLLPGESLAVVAGSLGALSMAVVNMLSGITGTKEKEEKPELTIIKELIEKGAEDEPMSVDVTDDRVSITKGNNTITTQKDSK